MKTLWIISVLFPPDVTSTVFISGEKTGVRAKKCEVKVICGPVIYGKRKKKTKNMFVLDSHITVSHVKGSG